MVVGGVWGEVAVGLMGWGNGDALLVSTYVYMYICMCVYIHVSIQCVYIYMYVYMYADEYIHILTRMYVAVGLMG